MNVLMDTTIAAIATPRGTGGVAIIRLSGSDSWRIAQALSYNYQRQPMQWEPGRVFHDWVVDRQSGEMVDEVFFLPFRGPRSYTGEDSVEIHCHGGLVVSKAILDLCFTHGAQAATAGEFTRRAVLNGRIDLTQAESILDLIHAQGEALVKLSANNLRHRAVGQLLENYMGQITAVQADMVASIDFPDEVDEPDRQGLCARLGGITQALWDQIEINRRNQIVRDGIEVALIGLPNSGKSSLFNALLQSERSIVTEIEGTTRDIIRESLSLKGIPVTLVDTAGIRETQERVEVLGVERSWQAIEASQVLIYVVDGTKGIQPSDQQVLSRLEVKTGLLIYNKKDTPGFQAKHNGAPPQWEVMETSAVTGDGVERVLSWLETKAMGASNVAEMGFILSQRQIQTLSSVHRELNEARDTLNNPHIPLDLATVPLTRALLELQGLLGHDTTEGVLDSVFSRFCVGK